MGSWGACSNDVKCEQIYTITTELSGHGTPCEATNGAIKACKDHSQCHGGTGNKLLWYNDKKKWSTNFYIKEEFILNLLMQLRFNAFCKFLCLSVSQECFEFLTNLIFFCSTV